MPQSDNAKQIALDAVAREINELTRLCGEIDAALKTRDWPRMGKAIGDSRRVAHAMEQAMAEATPYRDQAFDHAVFVRMQQIFTYRSERFEALSDIHDDIGRRLAQLARWKQYSRSIAGREPVRGISAIDGVR